MNNKFELWSDDRRFRAGYDAGYTKGHEDGYNAAKAEQAPSGWIPCSERLPGENKEYNVTVLLFYRKDKKKRISTTMRFIPDGDEGDWCEIGSPNWSILAFDYQILAWQPLPEPYNPDNIVDPNKKDQGGVT